MRCFDRPTQEQAYWLRKAIVDYIPNCLPEADEVLRPLLKELWLFEEQPKTNNVEKL